MSAGSPDSAAQRNGPRPSQNCGRMNAGHEARVRRRRPRPRPPARRRAGCCRSRRRPRRRAGTSSIARTWAAIDARDRALVLGRERARELDRVGQRDLRRDVAGQRVVRRGLVGHEVEPLAGGGPRGLDLGGVADQGDAHGLAPGGGLARPGERLGGVVGEPVDVADVEAAPRARLVDLDRRWPRRRSSSPRAAARRPSRRGPPSASRSRGACRRSAGGPPPRRSRTCPAGSPGSRCRSTSRRSSGRTSSGRCRSRSRKTSQVAHLPTRFELAIRTRGAHRGCARPRPACRDWTSSVSSSPSAAELADDRVEGVPAPRRAAGAAVDDEVVRVLGDLRVEVVHQHPERRFLLPAAAGQLGAARGSDGAWVRTSARSLLLQVRHDLLARARAARATVTDTRSPSARWTW